MKRAISIGAAAALGVGSVFLGFSSAAQATQFAYDCDIPEVGSTEVDVDFETSLPDTAEPNDSLPFDVDLTVTLPPEAATALYDEGARTTDGSASEEFEISTSNGATYFPVVDITFDESAVAEGESLELSGAGTTDSLSLSSEGEVDIYAGPLDVELSLYDDEGAAVPFEPFSCTGPPGNSVIHTVVFEKDDDDPDPIPTTTTLEVAEPVVDWGDVENELIATVEDDDGEPGSGEVEFFLNGSSMGDAIPTTDGVATMELYDSISAGVYEVRAVFSPIYQDDYEGSNDRDSFAVYVDTETDLEMTKTEFAPGEDVEAIATVTTVPEEAGNPHGDVVFEIDGLPDSDAHNGTPATWEMPTEEFPPGEYTMVATFEGNTAFGDNVSEEIEFTVLPEDET